MRIIGADPSLTGFGIATPEGVTTLRPPKDMRGAERMVLLRNWFLSIIRDHPLGLGEYLVPDLVVIEGFSYNSKGSSIYEIAGLGWILRVALHEASIPYVEVSPDELKKYATGKTSTQGAKKEDVLVEAVKRLGYEGSDNNQSDALWLRTMGEDYYNGPLGVVPQAQRDVLYATVKKGPRKGEPILAWPDLRAPA